PTPQSPPLPHPRRGLPPAILNTNHTPFHFHLELGGSITARTERRIALSEEWRSPPASPDRYDGCFRRPGAAASVASPGTGHFPHPSELAPLQPAWRHDETKEDPCPKPHGSLRIPMTA